MPQIWNPLPWFETVREDNQVKNVQAIDQYFIAAKNGTLPSVVWINPNQTVSEHPRPGYRTARHTQPRSSMPRWKGPTGTARRFS